MSGDAQVILVGSDGSTAGKTAVDHAARIAARDHATLEILHAYQHPYGYYSMLGAVYPVSESEEWRRAAAEFLTAEAERVSKEFPDVPEVRVTLVQGGAALSLVDASRTAVLTVVGARGAGGFAQLLLGAVSTQVAGHAHGVVEVVHEGDGERDRSPVVVGYDGSDASALALRFAVGEAVARGVRLIVARFYDSAFDNAAERAQEAMAAVKTRLASEHPGLEVEALALVGENAAYGLAELSRDAGLTVVGSRGHGGFTGLLLGSVSQGLLHHAHGPVAVVHERKTS
ncbi:universal stress protein UspA [Actinorhabdospora filicis]|uniref:Universal stress protein UspA n=1 Tax=Actinorhabdospora filicis TaxID=1785913 RepID=A0A9W6W9K3_9ACTN|nr:universal stress protein [Actinorhabdospora filicis]GLZ78083.1 universal stress protein UspA [Actinorhabdospora filicis]